ncbi:MAG: hypothetical protein QXS41_02335 [Candidatus Woesearchaeota archaeon]
MSIAKLKKGLKELKNDEIFTSMYNEIKSTTKELNEIYRLVIDYPFAAEVKDKLTKVDQRFKELSKMIDELKKQHNEQQIFKARMREKILNLNRKINKMSALLTLHQLIINKNDEQNQIIEKLKKIANKEELISQLEKFDVESLENKTNFDLIESQIDSLNSELDILVPLLEEKLNEIDQNLEKEKDELEQLKQYVKRHDDFINKILEDQSIIELLKKHSKELIVTEEKNNKEEPKEEKEKKEEINIKINDNNTTNISSKNKNKNKEKNKKIKNEKNTSKGKIKRNSTKKIDNKKITQKEKNQEINKKLNPIEKQIKEYESIVKTLPDGNLKNYYIEKINQLREKLKN